MNLPVTTDWAPAYPEIFQNMQHTQMQIHKWTYGHRQSNPILYRSFLQIFVVLSAPIVLGVVINKIESLYYYYIRFLAAISSYS